MMKGLKCVLERFEGQPVKCFTDDGRIHRGVVAEVFDNVLRIVRNGGCVEDIATCHIDAIQEAQMVLRHCKCNDWDREADYEEDFEEEDFEEEEEEECHCRRCRSRRY